MIKGIDVSRWQGDIDWPKVADDGVKFAFIKATEGITYTDPKLRRNAFGAHAVGLKVGFYHFLRVDNTDPIKEANNFVSAIQTFNYEWTVCDVEDAKGKTAKWIVDYTRSWLAEVEKRTGKRPLVYTYVSFAKTYLGNNLTDYPLWLAHYVNSAKPSSSTGWGDNWVCWQYTDKGSVKGIQGYVDLNWMKPDFFETVKPLTPFKDVPAGHWAEQFIKDALNAGIMVGHPDGTFGLGKPVTREELAVVVSKLLKEVRQ